MDTNAADQFLVSQIRDGSQDAWRQLIDRYEGRLTAFARMHTASLTDAEDLVQEAFVGFLQSLNHYDSRRTLETYLFTIVRYKLYDQFRRRKIVPLNPPPDSENFWDDILPGVQETPGTLAVTAEEQSAFEEVLEDLLRRLIHHLRDRDAFEDLQVIELVFYKGMRNLDVANLLEIDQKAVAGIKFRAVQKLRKFLEDRDEPMPVELSETKADVTVARVWRERRLTCLKRSTLGSSLLGVLEEPWKSYTQFHLDVVACPMCLANLEDMQVEHSDKRKTLSDSIFASSIGFLSRRSDPKQD